MTPDQSGGKRQLIAVHESPGHASACRYRCAIRVMYQARQRKQVRIGLRLLQQTLLETRLDVAQLPDPATQPRRVPGEYRPERPPLQVVRLERHERALATNEIANPFRDQRPFSPRSVASRQSTELALRRASHFVRRPCRMSWR